MQNSSSAGRRQKKQTKSACHVYAEMRNNSLKPPYASTRTNDTTTDMKKLQKPRMEDYDRNERRERDKLARQQVQNSDTEKQPLFSAPVRLSPSEGDPTITSKLGDFSIAKRFINEQFINDRKIVIGISTSNPRSSSSSSSQPHIPPVPSSSGGSSSSSSNQVPPSNRNPPPPHHYHQPHPPPSRGTYIKQSDNKTSYNGRGGYPGQSVKHDIHTSGIAPAKGPPQPPPPSQQQQQQQQQSQKLPPPAAPPPLMPNGRPNDKMLRPPPMIPNGRFQVPLPKPPKFMQESAESSSSLPLPINGDVENIIKEMTMSASYTPLTEIAATPRKEMDSKFTFGQPNPHKYAELPPPLIRAALSSRVEREKSVPKQTTELENDLDLSESDDERKKQTSMEKLSPIHDPSSESSESASSESGSEESNGPNKGETINQTSTWTLSKFFKTPVQNESTPQQSMQDNSSHSNEPIIKHEPVTPIDDVVLSSSPVTPYRNVNSNNSSNSNQLPILLSEVKKENAIIGSDPKKDNVDVNQYQINNKTNSISNNGHVMELPTPVQIKNETFDKSPSSSPEKVQHSDTIESDQIESVLAEAKELAEIKPVSEIGTSSGEEEKKKVKRKKSPSKRPVKKVRKTPKDKKAGSDSSDEEDEFSSTNTLSSRRSRSKSIDQEKKGRGRPRKNIPLNTGTTGSTVLKVATPSKKDVTKKVTARRRMSTHSNIKSRETLDTTDSSSDDDKAPPKPTAPIPVPQSKIAESPKTIPVNRTLCQIQKGPIAAARSDGFKTGAHNRNDDDDDDDDDDDENMFHSSSPTGEDRLSSPPPENSRQHFSPAAHRTSVRSKVTSSSSSSDDHSDSDSDDLREDKKIRDKTKSDKNKSDTLRKLFLGLNKGEGGAKGKGQVHIVDHQTEESQNQGKETSTHHEKLLSPISAFKHSSASNSATNDTAHTNHLATKSPRTPLSSSQIRTPERSSISLNKIQPVTPTSRSTTPINSTISITSNRLICKIELSRLLHIPPEWKQNSYVLHGRSPATVPPPAGAALTNVPEIIHSISNRSGRSSVPSVVAEDDFIRSPISRLKSHRNPENISNSRENLSNIDSGANNPKIMTPPLAVPPLASSNSIISNSNSRLAAEAAVASIAGPPAAVGNLATLHNRSGVLGSGSISNNNNSCVNNIVNTNPHVLTNRDHDAIPLDASTKVTSNTNNYSGFICVNNRVEPPQQLLQNQQQQRLAAMCITGNNNNGTNLLHSPKMEDRLLLANQAALKSGIKRELIKSEFMDDYGNYKPPLPGNVLGQSDDKYNIYNSSKLSNNNSVKQEQLIKNEYELASHNNPALLPNELIDSTKQPPHMVAINNNAKLIGSDEYTNKSRRKRSSSPFRDKRRKKNEGMEQLPPTNHDRLPDKVNLPPPQPPINDIYRDRSHDVDIIKEGWDHTKYLDEAKRFKHAADKESDHFDQVKLYLRAAIFFLIAAAALEEEKRTDSAFSLYKETLVLIKHICSKIGPTQPMQGSGNHNKIQVLSLRCQSYISYKLYKMRRYESKEAQRIANDFFNKGNEIPNGNTPSISPTNSVCSRGSGSTTPPMQMVPVQVYAALDKQTLYFNYLACCHDLWDQADNLVRKDTHSDFFISLDQEHGPLTLHSSIYDVFRYVQAGLKKLKDL